MAYAMDTPEFEPEPHYRQQADWATRHALGVRAKNQIDYTAIRNASFIPRSLDSWDHLYYYRTKHDW